MAISTVDGLAAAIAGGQDISFLKTSMTAKAAGSLQSLWTQAGNPGAGSTPATGAGAAPTNSTAGALPLVNASGGNTLYLGAADVAFATAGVAFLVDRLVHTSGLSGTSTSAQTVNSTAISRAYNGPSVAPWAFLEIYTATGGTAVTATISYTNQAGTSGQSGTAALIATPVAGQLIPITLAAGDTGIESIQSVTLSATTGTAGNFGITLAQKIGAFPGPTASSAAVEDFGVTSLAQIAASACLALIVLPSTTSTGLILGDFDIIQG